MFTPHMTGDNHQDQQSAHCSLTTILMIRRLCARLLMTSHHYYCSIKKGDGTARRALLKAVSILSLERGPLVPTQILWKQLHVVTVFSTSREKTIYYWTPNLVEKIVRKEGMSESPSNGQHTDERFN